MKERFRMSAAILLAVALLAVSSGCQPANPSSVPAPTIEGTIPQATSAASEEKSIVVVIAEDPPSFNPIIADSGYDALVMEFVMLGLSDLDPDGNVFPELAAEIPSEENGGVVIDEETGTMTVTWKMRQDVQWADGAPLWKWPVALPKWPKSSRNSRTILTQFSNR